VVESELELENDCVMKYEDTSSRSGPRWVRNGRVLDDALVVLECPTKAQYTESRDKYAERQMRGPRSPKSLSPGLLSLRIRLEWDYLFLYSSSGWKITMLEWYM